jgi:hypothetical protein
METHLRMVEAAEVQFAESEHAPNGARAADPPPAAPPRPAMSGEAPPSLPEDASSDRTILRTGYAGERTGWRPA